MRLQGGVLVKWTTYVTMIALRNFVFYMVVVHCLLIKLEHSAGGLNELSNLRILAFWPLGSLHEGVK